MSGKGKRGVTPTRTLRLRPNVVAELEAVFEAGKWGTYNEFVAELLNEYVLAEPTLLESPGRRVRPGATPTRTLRLRPQVQKRLESVFRHSEFRTYNDFIAAMLERHKHAPAKG